MEFEKNKEDKFYDFTGIAVKYGKSIEMEAYLFFKALFSFLAVAEKEIMNIKFEVQGISHIINDLDHFRPNLGTYKFLISHPLISKTIDSYDIKWITAGMFSNLSIVQTIRNKAAHESQTSLEEIETLRNAVLGIKKIESCLIF